jgi:hypothetical protein
MRAGPEAVAMLDRKSRTNPMTMAMRFMITSLDGVIFMNKTPFVKKPFHRI